MAGRKKQRRIEPSFGTPARRKRGLSVTDADRAVPTGRKKAGRSKAKRGSRRAPAKRKRGGFFRLLSGAVYWSLVLCIWAGIGVAGIAAYYGAKMPSATTWAIPDRPPNVKIVSMDGSLIANRGITGGEAVGLHQMSPYIPQAVIAIEDRRFYSHFGIDPLGLARAMFENITSGRLVQGGSTLTQQLAKNLFLKPDRTIERKVQEVLLALWLEHTYEKDQILTFYLNRVYFGSGAHGVEAAARRYYDKPARDVTLPQAALLAGLLKAPSRLSPARDPQAAEDRSQIVLAAMREQGMIGDKEFTYAMSTRATRAAAYWTGSQHYVADRVMAALPALVGEVKGDIIVDTTVDLTMQKNAETAIRARIREDGKKHKVSQGALVSIDMSGAVRALVGGVDYASSQFDRASDARRQPGSAFKPFVYLAALEAGARPESARNDAPVRFGKWRPENYRDKYYGRVTLATALKKSLNSVAAQLAMEVGPKMVVSTAHRLGITSDMKTNASIALGTSEVSPLELTAAYLPFANGGFRPETHIIRRITTASGKILYEHKGNAPRVVRPEFVGMMNYMMAGTVREGTGRKADFGWPAAGKTGTSQNARDAWFVGYTAHLVTGVWFGNDDASAMSKVTGGSLPTVTWKDFMTAAHQNSSKVPLPGGWKWLPETIKAPVLAGDSARPAARPKAPVFDPNGNGDHTASINAPRPKVGVGDSGRHETSILDIILGR